MEPSQNEMDAKEIELVDRLSQSAEIRASLSEKITDLAKPYAPSEENPNGIKMKGSDWDSYELFSEQLIIHSNSKKILTEQLEELRGGRQELEKVGITLRDAFVAYAMEGEKNQRGVHQLTQAERDFYISEAPNGNEHAGKECFSIRQAMELDTLKMADTATTRTGTGADGSIASAIDTIIPRDLLIEVMKAYGGAASVVSTFSTEHGLKIQVPNIDATGQVGVILNENTAAADLDIPDLGHITLGDYIYASKVATVSRQALRDASFNVGSFIQNAMVVRNARIMSEHCVNGTDAGQPQGFMTKIKAGVTTAAAGVFTWPELLELYGEVDDAYLMGPPGHGHGDGGTIGYCMNKKTQVALMQLADADKRPLFLPNIHNMAEMTLFGFPVRKVYEIDDIGDDKLPIAFGNFGYYLMRSVGETLMLRFDDSPYAKRGAVGFLAFNEGDGRWTHPIDANGHVACATALKIKAA